MSCTWRMGWFVICFDFIYGSGIFDSDTGCDSK